MPIPKQEEFASPPNSLSVNKTTNMRIYFTDKRREFVTEYYQNEYQRLHCGLLKPFNPYCYFKPLKINHSPNLASSYIAPKQKSTYLEEYFYPLTDALIVNGYEPYNEKGIPFNKNSVPLMPAGKQYNSEVIVRYVSSSVLNRIFIYILICFCILMEVKLFRTTIKQHE